MSKIFVVWMHRMKWFFFSRQWGENRSRIVEVDCELGHCQVSIRWFDEFLWKSYFGLFWTVFNSIRFNEVLLTCENAWRKKKPSYRTINDISGNIITSESEVTIHSPFSIIHINFHCTYRDCRCTLYTVCTGYSVVHIIAIQMKGRQSAIK